MKKIISTLMVAVACMLTTIPAQAQLRWGLKFGLNLNKVDFKNLPENVKADNATGYFVGPMVDFTFPIIGLGMDASLLYSQKGAKIIYKDDHNRDLNEINRQHAIEIPVNLKYSFGMGDLASIFVTAGPGFSFNLKGDNFGKYFKSESSIKRNKADVSANVGAGLKLINHLQIAANYSIPLTKTKERIEKDKMLEFENKTWQISLAYMF